MKIKKILEYFKLKAMLGTRMVHVNETMALQDASMTYAKYVCKMEGWYVMSNGSYTPHFCAVELAFMDGYIKAMHDNGYEFQNGLVKKRDITNEMPCGALDYYRKDAIAETKAKAIEHLREVLSKYETSKTNINFIVKAFEDKIKDDNEE
jgi:hypothetical protein